MDVLYATQKTKMNAPMDYDKGAGKPICKDCGCREFRTVEAEGKLFDICSNCDGRMVEEMG